MTAPVWVAEAEAPVAPAEEARTPSRSRRAARGWLGLAPFLAYTTLFLVVPTLIVIVGAFQSEDDTFTLDNFERLFEPNVVEAMVTSIWVSLVSALIGAVVGGLASYALVVASNHSSALRRIVVSLSSVLAQFGGVMLAFAFIATIGVNGVVTLSLRALFEIEVDPNWLSTLPGLILIYSYFQIPLMVIVFVPAIDNIRPQWREATESLGGNTWTYWRRVAGPILFPRFLGAVLLLFANAFSAYATAAALFSQRSILITLMIQGALRNEQAPGQQGFAKVLAFAMIVVVAVVMAAYSALERRSARWEE